MPVIKSFVNPRTRHTDHWAEGRIKYINIKPVKDKPNAPVVDGVRTTWIKQAGQPDKKIEATHSISFLLETVDEAFNVVEGIEPEWISVGETKLHPSHTDKVQIKDPTTGEYKTLLVGMIVSIPLKIDVKGDKTFINGNRAKTTVLDETNAIPLGQAAPKAHTSPAASSNGATKVYGTITEVQGTNVQVKQEDGSVVSVSLSEAQVAELVDGGRLTGMIDSAGVLVSGFKAYGPAGSTPSRAKYDDLPIRLGNAVTIVHAMYPDEDIVDQQEAIVNVLSVMDSLRTELAAEYKDMDAKSIGSRLGQSGIVCASHALVSLNDFSTAVKSTFKMITDLEGTVRTANAPVAQEPVKTEPKPKTSKPKAPVVSAPPVHENPPVEAYGTAIFDEDMDIPF